jgi:hypothetical protein
MCVPERHKKQIGKKTTEITNFTASNRTYYKHRKYIRLYSKHWRTDYAIKIPITFFFKQKYVLQRAMGKQTFFLPSSTFLLA